MNCRAALRLVILGLLFLPLSLAQSDSDPSNNAKVVTVEVIEAHSLNVTFTRYVEGALGGITQDIPTYGTTAEGQRQLLHATFPVSDAQFQSTIQDNTVHRWTLDSKFDCLNTRMFQDLLKAYAVAQTDNYTYDKIVGIIPANGFVDNGTLGCVSQERTLRAAIVMTDKAGNHTLAHEVSHTYDVCHDANETHWNASRQIFNGCRNRNQNGTYSGYNCDGSFCYLPNSTSQMINQLFENASLSHGFSSHSSPSLVSYMFGTTSAVLWNSLWVDNDTYSVLLDAFGANHNTISTSGTVITVVGAVNNQSGGSFDRALYETRGGIIDNSSEFSNGTVSITTFDAAGTLVNNYSYVPNFGVAYANGSVVEANQSGFVLRMPRGNITTIKLSVNGLISDTITATAHSPSLNLSQPQANRTYEGAFNITWTAADTDGGPIYTAVMLSNDGGETWAPISIDMNGSQLSLNTANYGWGGNYSVKIVSTDGINSATCILNGTFTMIPPPSIAVPEASLLYANGTRAVVEALATNDGNHYNLSRVEWSLATGEGTVSSVVNSSLNVSEAMTVIVEYNYSSGGQKTVTFTARDQNKSVSDNASITITVNGTASPSLSTSLLVPSGNVNVTRNSFFNVTAQVCCTGATCGTVNVSLDPATTEYDYYHSRTCTGGECMTTYYSSPRFGYEGIAWKPIEELHSFKGNVPIDCIVAGDGVHEVTCTDYNATHRTLRITDKITEQSVPIRVVADDGIQVATVQTIKLTKGTPADIIVPARLSDIVHVGATSTNVSYVPTSAPGFAGSWEPNATTLALYNWTNCDANNYSTSDISAISDGNSGTSIYGSGGGSGTNYTYCHRMRWQINENPANITNISTWAYWTGSLSGGADSITKALYLGNVTGQRWNPLDVQQSAWGAYNHTGSVAAGINDYVQNNGTYYVYTLLHYNASKAGSTYAYTNFYDTSLTITTGTNGTSNQTGKGLVSTTVGATPFYTNTTNPRTITLNASQCQNVTWAVNATGATSTTYAFFAYTNLTSNQSVSAKTASINITITNSTGNGSGNATLPQLVANYTFTTSNEGFTLGAGWNWDNSAGILRYNGSDWGGNLYSPNLSLTQYPAYNITIVFTTGNITYTKLAYASSGTSITGDKYHFERSTDTTQHFKHDSAGYSGTDDYNDGTTQTVRISANFTQNGTRACRTGGSCSNNESTGAFNRGDYISITPGVHLGKDLNITTIEVWRTG